MKREEFFEALSDIDENMVACAKSEEEAVVPVMVTPKKSLVKPICAGAACAVLTAGLITAVVINANRQPDSILNPNETLEGREAVYKTTIMAENRPPYEAQSQKVTSFAEELNLERWQAGITVEFEMGEFTEEVFRIADGELYVRKSGDNGEGTNIIGNLGCYVNLGSTYLCDLNGDGKREICTEISFGSGIVNNFIWALDYAGDKQYALNARGEWDYFLRKKDGELEYLSSPYDISMTLYPDENASGAPLTLDVMKEFKPYADPGETVTTHEDEAVIQIMDFAYASNPELCDIPVEFDMEEFPDVLFLREPDNVYGDGLYVIKGDSESPIPVFRCKSISSIYICDLNGDGKCEIAAGIRLTDKYGSDKIVGKSIVVIDYANSCAYLLSDEENFTYTLSDEYDTLYVNKFDDKLYRDLILEPLTLDMMRSEIAVGNSVMFQLPVSSDEKPAETEAPSSDTEKISFSKNMGGYSICVGIEAVKCMHGKDCYDLLQHENNIYIKDSSGSVICSRAFPWEINIAPEADSTELTFEVLEFDGGNILAMGFPVNVNGEQCRRMSFFYFDNSSITFALVGDEFIFDETHPVIRGDLWQEDDCVCFTSRSIDGGFDGCHYLTDFGNCRFTHCAGADPTLHKLNHNHDHDHENHNHDHESGQQDESYIELDVHPYEVVPGGEKGGRYSFDYDGTLYSCPECEIPTYIIDHDNDIFARVNDTMEFNPESRIDAAMKDIAGYYENFEYVGKIRDTYLGGFLIDEGYVYRHGDDLIIICNCDNDVRYNPDICERLYNIKFTDEERHDLLGRKIDFEETLLKYGVEYDSSIYYAALLYEPCEEASDTQKITYNKNMGDYSICVNIEAEECRHGRRCYDLHQNENNICIRDGSGNVVCSRAFPWEINVIPEADSTDLTFEVLEFDGGNMLAMGFPVNVNGVQCRRMSFFCFDKSSIDFAGIGDNYNFDETNPVIRGDLRCEDNCICFSALGSDGSFGDCHYLTDFSHRCFTHCEGSNCANHNHNYNHNYGNGNGYGYGYGANGNNSANTNSTTNSTHHSDSHHSNHH